MICKGCRKAAKKTRKARDKSPSASWVFPHPENCGCPCQHKEGLWEKLYSVERPNA